MCTKIKAEKLPLLAADKTQTQIRDDISEIRILSQLLPLYMQNLIKHSEWETRISDLRFNP